MAIRLTAHDSIDLELAVPWEVSAELCRAALRGLGWEVSESGEEIEAAEPAERLCCVTWPVDLTIALAEGDQQRSRVTIEASTPGRGPLQQRQLRDRLAQFRAELLDRAQKR
jgi:hypothetical protein